MLTIIPRRQPPLPPPIRRRGWRRWRWQRTAGQGSPRDLTRVLYFSNSLFLFNTCDGNFPRLIFDGGKVGCTPSPGDDNEEEGGGDEAVEDQDEEDQHVVRLQIFRRLKTPSQMDVAPWDEHWIEMVLEGIVWYSMILDGIAWYSMV